MNKELASRALGKPGFLVLEKERQTNRERPSLGGWAPIAASPRALSSLSPKVNRQSRKRQEVACGKCKGGKGDGHGIGLTDRQAGNEEKRPGIGIRSEHKSKNC